MTIEQLILNATDKKEFQAVEILNKVLIFSKQKNISIHKAARYLKSLKPKTYELNILNIVLRYYPNDNPNAIIKTDTNSVNISKQKEETVGTTYSFEDFIKNKPIIKYIDQ